MINDKSSFVIICFHSIKCILLGSGFIIVDALLPKTIHAFDIPKQPGSFKLLSKVSFILKAFSLGILKHDCVDSVTGVYVTTGDLGLIWMKHKSKAYKYYLHFIYMSIYISSPGWYSISIWHYWLTE